MVLSRHLFLKTSKFKAKFALSTDRANDNDLSKEFCFFKRSAKKCKGLVSLIASVRYLLLRRLIPLDLIFVAHGRVKYGEFATVNWKESRLANFISKTVETDSIES